MKLQNPVYLPFAILLTLYLALANRHGWSLMHTLAPKSWTHRDPNTQHK